MRNERLCGRFEFWVFVFAAFTFFNCAAAVDDSHGWRTGNTEVPKDNIGGPDMGSPGRPDAGSLGGSDLRISGSLDLANAPDTTDMVIQPAEHGPTVTRVEMPRGPVGALVSVSGSGFQMGDVVVISGTNLASTALVTLSLSASVIIAVVPACNVATPAALQIRVERGQSRYPMSGLAFTLTKGTVHFIAPGGNDGHAGTQNAPWATLEGASRQMSPGDVTYLRGGSYSFGSAIVVSGTPGAPLTFAAFPGEVPTIASPANGRSDTLELQGNYLVVDGLQFTNQSTGITVSMNRGTHDNMVSNCEIFGGAQSGLIVSGNKNVIYHNHIHGNGTHAALDHGVYLEGDGNLVSWNTIHDNWSMGIQIYNGYGDSAGNNILEYNYLYHNGYGSPGVNQTYLNCEVYVGATNAPNNVIRNNVMCGNAHYAMYFWGKVPGTQVIGNVSCNNGSGGFYIDDAGAGTTIKNNLSYNDGGPALLTKSGPMSDHNSFFASGGMPTIDWNGTKMALAAYAAASGQDSHSMVVDPQLQGPPPKGAFSSAAAAGYNFCAALLPALCTPRP